jgi:hypothetical protein
MRTSQLSSAFLSSVLALALLTPAGSARAQSASEISLAKQTAGEGLTAYTAGEFDKALGLFNQARKIYPSAQILRMIGYSELGLEHWLKAVDAMQEALASNVTPLSKDDRKDVEDQLAKANAHLGTVTVRCKLATVKVSVDGAPPVPCAADKPLRLLEGAHKLVGSAPDHLDASVDVKVEGGKASEVALDPAPKAAPVVVLAPLPPPLPPAATSKGLFPHQREVGFGLLGGGVLAGVGALVTVIEAAHWRSMTNADVATHLTQYGQGCAMGDPRLCAYDISVTNGEGTTANELRDASIGLGVSALVLGGAGLALILTAPKAQPASDDRAPPPAVSWRCGAGGLSLKCAGTF